MSKKKLTDKQEAFCMAYMETLNASEAYRRAYNVGESTKKEVVWVKASELLNNGNVAVRLIELKEEVSNQYGITIQTIIEKHLTIQSIFENAAEILKDINPAELSRKEKSGLRVIGEFIKSGDYIRSLEMVAKYAGLEPATKHEHEHKAVIFQLTRNVCPHCNESLE